MKTPLLLPCLAVVSASALAAPKSPELVAREWNQSIERSRQALTLSKNLAGQSDALTTTPLEKAFSPEDLPPPPPINRPKREPLLDAPSYRIPQNLPNERPRGAVPWEYNGQTYWLVPLTPAGGK
jgi:hypothetical protein